MKAQDIKKLAEDRMSSANTTKMYFFSDGNIFLPTRLKAARLHEKKTGLKMQTVEKKIIKDSKKTK